MFNLLFKRDNYYNAGFYKIIKQKKLKSDERLPRKSTKKNSKNDQF